MRWRQPTQTEPATGLHEAHGTDRQKTEAKAAQASSDEMAGLMSCQRDEQNPQAGNQQDDCVHASEC